MTSLKFEAIPLPDIGPLTYVPELSADVYRKRFERLERAREEAGLDCLLIYADREHSANLSWLTNFDPRFEEALWIQGRNMPYLLVGNECGALARLQLRIEANIELYQPFSLPNQDRSKSTDLKSLLRKAGIERGMKCGIAGWKPMEFSEVPHWIVETVSDLVGSVPANANDLLMHPDYGLRTRLEPEMIQFVEYGHMLTSTVMREWVYNLKEGISERNAARPFTSFGLELACHPMVNFAPTISTGLRSPRNAVARRGDYAQGCFAVIGALTARAGRLMKRGDDDADNYLELVENYLHVVRAWYSSIKVGITAGDVVRAASSAKADSWEFALNPGHLISLDEWLASPFFNDSSIELKSGYHIQQDIIPVPMHSKASINMEDGFVLADAELRDELWRLDPTLMNRCEKRRSYMIDLGYELSEDVLPLSNIPGVFFPFLLEPRYIARFA